MQSQPGASGQPPVLTPIRNDAELETKLAEPGVKVVELYSWAGPCAAVVPALKQLKQKFEDSTRPDFLSVDASKCQLLEEARASALCCEPRFLVFLNGTLRLTIVGANHPGIEAAVARMLEVAKVEASLGVSVLGDENPIPVETNPFADAVADRGIGQQPQTVPAAAVAVTA